VTASTSPTLRAIVVEDDGVARRILTRTLESQGFEVMGFDSVEAALPALDGGLDLVLTDQTLPGKDGVFLVEHLRANADTAEVPIIMISAFEDPAQIERGLEAGADDCIVKPFRPAVLRAKAKHLIQSRQDNSPGWVFGDYRVEELLCRGARSSVWRAYHVESKQPVALKLMSRSILDRPEAAERFRREVKTLSELRLPHLVRFYEAGVLDDRPFLAMELAQGRTLEQVLSEGRLEPKDAYRLGRDVCSALKGLQTYELVHRNVKPANIVIGGDGQVTLIDFGHIKGRTCADVTRSSEIIGSPEYLSPEVVRGRPQTIVSDLYALGVVVYEALAGRVPFETTTTPFRLLARIANEEPAPALVDYRPGLPLEAYRLLQDLMQPDSDKRLRDPAVASTRFGRLSQLG
jgi:eukaryotic-like serine/threonine-protein kinase